MGGQMGVGNRIDAVARAMRHVTRPLRRRMATAIYRAPKDTTACYKDLAEALLAGRPYFGDAFASRQGDVRRHRYFASCVSALNLDRPIAALEIGSWAGSSAITWGMAIKRTPHSGSLLCVDQWAPYFDEAVHTHRTYRTMNEAARSDVIFNLFRHNVQAAGVADVVSWRRGDSRAILPTLQPASLDLVFIDGDHRYELADTDIKLAKGLLSERGIVCGDDLEMQAHELDATDHRRMLATGKEHVTNAAGQGYHPGVTEAVARHFGQVSAEVGFWAMQKSPLGWQQVALQAEPPPAHLPQGSPSPADLTGRR